MKWRFKLCGLLTALSFGTAHAACVNNPSDATGSLPVTTGKLVWHSYTSYGDGSSQIFVRDIAGGSTTQISGGTGWTGISDPMNAVWSADGNWLLFMAIKNNAWNIFVVPASGGTPTNLTNSTGTTRNEDPKFTSDGTAIIWKQKQSTTYRIQKASISFTGTPSLGTATTLVSGSVENSMPYVDSTLSNVYYAAGAGGSFTLKKSPLPSGSATTVSSNVSYYPIVNWTAMASLSANTVFWADQPSGGNDQIAYKNGGTGTTTYPSINNCNGNNSDPWPTTVSGADYVFFSATNGSGYQLYLGVLSSGARYNLSGWYSDTGKAHLGASYFGGNSGGGGGGGGGDCASTGTDVNVAQGKTASASSQYNGTTLAAGKAVDGNTSSTRWDSTEPMPIPTWWMVDFGTKKHVDGIDLYWDAAANAYTIDMSDDGSTWTTVYTQSNETSFSHRAIPQAQLNGGTPLCTRYIRVYGTQADTQWGMALWEFQAWGW